MKVFTLSLLCIVLFVAFAAATNDEEEDDEETEFLSDEFLSDEFQALSLSDENDDEAKGDLSTERVARTPIRVRTRRSRTPVRTRRPIRKPTRSPIRKPTRKPSRKPTRKPGRRPTRKPTTRCPIVTFPCPRMRSVCANMANAIKSGKPSILTRITNPSLIRRNRRASGCESLGKKAGHNCDEYPFASSARGGRGAVVKLVPVGESSIRGAALAAFCRRNKIGNGDCFKVVVNLAG